MMKREPFKIDRNGTKYYADYTCQRCGGQGGLDQWIYTGYTCYECGGSGRRIKPRIEKEYTPEYRAKLEKQRAARQAKKDAEAIAKSDEVNKQFKIDNGFNEDGKTYVILGNTYEIKDQLKEMGAKFDRMIGWYLPFKPENLPSVEIDIDEIYFKDHTHTYRWNYMVGYDENGNHPAVDKIKLANAKLNAELSRSEYVGEIGKRLELKVTYKKTLTFEKFKYGYYDTSYIYVHMFEDQNGNVFTWKTTNWLDAQPNEIVTMKGTVKEHVEYKGIKQTALTRCKIL